MNQVYGRVMNPPIYLSGDAERVPLRERSILCAASGGRAAGCREMGIFV